MEVTDAGLAIATVLKQEPNLWTDGEKLNLKRKAGMVECIQRPGEIIYVPASWKHATSNLEDCIAFGAQDVSLGKEGITIAPRTVEIKVRKSQKQSGVYGRKGKEEL